MSRAVARSAFLFVLWLAGCGSGSSRTDSTTPGGGGAAGSGGGATSGASGTGGGNGGAGSGGMSVSCQQSCDCIDPCPKAALPAAAGPPVTLAITKLGFPDIDAKGVIDKKSLWAGAFNLDGLAFPTQGAPGHCKPYQGAKASDVVIDGPNGVDNSFGENIWPITVGFASDASAQLDAAIAGGTGTLVIRVDALGPSPDQGAIASTFSVARGTVDATGAPVPPGDWSSYAWHPIGPWDNSIAPVLPTTTTATWNDGWMVARTWVSGSWTDVPFWLQGWSGSDTRLVLHHAVVSATMAPDGKSATGRIGGVIAVSEFLWAVSLTATLGCAAGLCPVGFQEQLRQAADMMHDGTQDPGQTCDGISLGLTFEATASTLSPDFVGAPLTGTPCCPPSP